VNTLFFTFDHKAVWVWP